MPEAPALRFEVSTRDTFGGEDCDQEQQIKGNLGR
jgi:hypothetical protein